MATRRLLCKVGSEVYIFR